MPLWDQLRPGQKLGLAGAGLACLVAVGLVGERALARPDAGEIQLVPRRENLAPAPAGTVSPQPIPPFPERPPKLKEANFQVSLSTASEYELQQIPGIGPELARALIEHRKKYGPFRTEEDVIAVPGIGPVRWETMRPYSRP